MTDASLSTIYREYIDCLNRQDWAELEQFVHDEVHYNGEPIGLSGYREMLERDFREIPDLHFDIPVRYSYATFHRCSRGSVPDPGLHSIEALVLKKALGEGRSEA